MFKIASRFQGVRGAIFWGRDGLGYTPKKWVKDDGAYRDCTLSQFKDENWFKYGCEDLDPERPYATIEDMGDAGCLPSIVAIFIPHGSGVERAHGIALPQTVTA